ncbi:MAG: ATP-binding cassette domain-containing protein [Lachnospiraceae bacterium]|nr:ATP-binding cassette domain-containing protein [Lachnospiraceae bacterium]
MDSSKILIRTEKLCKSFKTKDSEVRALEDIDLEIREGEIYGIIGMSGAGKSTLVRCLNYLEKPTSGDVFFEGRKLGDMSLAELNTTRRKMGMIFQQFNLLMQRNILKNVRFPLELEGVKKDVANAKAKELLDLVDLGEKAEAYPSQLSGGQKQRVAIARALALNPKVLLCDEATSALDPKTTRQILDQLKKINKLFGITIIVITHEMKVIEDICTRVAIISDSRIVEEGPVIDIFSNPKTEAARRLIYTGQSQDGEEVAEQTKAFAQSEEKMLRIVFDGKSSYEPVIANMILEFKVPVNIMRADTRNIGGNAVGQMVLQLPKEEAMRSRIKDYLRGHGLNVEEVDPGEY